MKTKLSLLVVCLLLQLPAFGQGQFLFNTHDLAGGNDVRFYWEGIPASGPDLFVQVLASFQRGNYQPVGTPMPLNRTGDAAGYTNPFGQVITTTLAAGSVAYVAYSMFQGSSYETARAKTTQMDSIFGSPTPMSIVLTAPPAPPNEIALGTGGITFSIPEPKPLALAAIGVSLFALWGRFGRWNMPVVPEGRNDSSPAFLRQVRPSQRI